ncbi:hypothetical protein IGI04_033530 [Brassica rapa subsp. trilocularis]|uniref:Uncharacterized protein n=1 Tax=Brassica rapa subsp. trilocularis TaxID=1813537 RepID=A0ABQ7L8X7_BRACM|nr:hypothetical protein IGI04_033530 [Brassica rapa subsp. trilocularis]
MVPLRYTPRRFVVHPKKKLLVIVEEREAARKECFEAGGVERMVNAVQIRWRMVRTMRIRKTRSVMSSPKPSQRNNEAAYSVCTVNFHDKEYGTLMAEQFPTLPIDLQRKIAVELDRTPTEILKKLEDARNKII